MWCTIQGTFVLCVMNDVMTNDYRQQHRNAQQKTGSIILALKNRLGPLQISRKNWKKCVVHTILNYILMFF
jgi:hypothetical protein